MLINQVIQKKKIKLESKIQDIFTGFPGQIQ